LLIDGNSRQNTLADPAYPPEKYHKRPRGKCFLNMQKGWPEETNGKEEVKELLVHDILQEYNKEVMGCLRRAIDRCPGRCL